MRHHKCPGSLTEVAPSKAARSTIASTETMGFGMKNAYVSLLAEIPQELHESLKSYLDAHPSWDQDRVFAAALSLFLLQDGSRVSFDSPAYRDCSRVYLESVFP